MQIIVPLPNFPDWLVPMTKIVPVFKLLDAYDFDTVDISTDFFYTWIKINDTDYELQINIEGSATLDDNDIPLYVDLDLVIVNENEFYNVQSLKN